MSGFPRSDQKVAGITSRQPEAVKRHYGFFQTMFWKMERMAKRIGRSEGGFD